MGDAAGTPVKLRFVAVTPGDLTGTERAVLLVLMAESRPVPNPDLVALGPKLEKPGREKLNTLGLIESERIGNRIVHELTDRGWRVCREILSASPPKGATGAAKALSTVLGGLDRYLDKAEISLADVFGHTTEDSARPSADERIRAAYATLAPRPGDWVPLSRLRRELTDLSRGEIDTGLRQLHRAAGVSLIREENQKSLTDSDRDAAIVIGDQPKHLIMIEP